MYTKAQSILFNRIGNVVRTTSVRNKAGYIKEFFSIKTRKTIYSFRNEYSEALEVIPDKLHIANIKYLMYFFFIPMGIGYLMAKYRAFFGRKYIWNFKYIPPLEPDKVLKTGFD